MASICHAGTIGFWLAFVSLAGGEYFGTQVTASLGPFIVLLGQDRADEADDGAAAGEDADQHRFACVPLC
jgi:hypothetical protein